MNNNSNSNNNTAICKMKDACRSLPILSCDYSVKKELRCKGESKPMAESSFDGFFEVPLIILILAALAIGVMMSACTCGAFTLCRCRHHRKHHR